MKKLGAAALLIAALALTGCSGASTYSSPEALTDAYVEAGGECDNPKEVPEEMLSEGAHGMLCAQPLTMLIVFDSAEAKDRYLARTGDSELHSYGGDQWLASSESEEVVSKLGGSKVER